jgi:alpha-tubulin suppressor-like RCC1 family protein
MKKPFFSLAAAIFALAYASMSCVGRREEVGDVSLIASAVSAGVFHTIVLRINGEIWTWGDNNDYGQLGLGDYEDRNIPTRVGMGTDWAAVSAGYCHTLGIKKDGSLWAWGYNFFRQLWLGDYEDRNIPTRVGLETDWAAVSAGDWHTLAIKKDGGLWAWGYDVWGQLGLDGNKDGTASPPTRVGLETDWAVVSTSDKHTLAIKKDGSLWAWGYNDNGQLGLGYNHNGIIHSPTRVGTGNDWAAVLASYYHTLGIKRDGSLWAWGYNDNGRLGLGDNDDRNSPTRVGMETDWAAVSAGERHTLGIKKDGTLWAWGWNGRGQLGLGDNQARNIPTRVGMETDWVAVSAGNAHTLGVKRDGTVWAWGYDGYGGRLGLGDDDWGYRNSPVRVTYNPAK